MKPKPQHTPKQVAAAIAVDALFYALQGGHHLTEEGPPSHRAKSRVQIEKLLTKIADSHGLEYTLPAREG